MEFKYEPVEHTRWVITDAVSMKGIIAIEEAATLWKLALHGTYDDE